jgi:hypothetical protein
VVLVETAGTGGSSGAVAQWGLPPPPLLKAQAVKGGGSRGDAMRRCRAGGSERSGLVCCYAPGSTRLRCGELQTGPILF